MTLWDKWLKVYPDIDFTKDVLHDIENDYQHGSFSQALMDDDLSKAMATADMFNLKRLERLVGITKNEYGIKHWGWPADNE